MTEQLRRETQADVKLQSVQGIFPTVTKFGMAALLPHKELGVELNGKILKVTADGMSTDAGYRDKILKSAKPSSVAVKYTDLVGAKRADRSAMVKGMDVVYIYHDTIDEASHTADSMVFPACDDAIQELKNLTRSYVMTSAERISCSRRIMASFIRTVRLRRMTRSTRRASSAAS